jgi:hypothetical protein
MIAVTSLEIPVIFTIGDQEVAAKVVTPLTPR